MARQRSWTDDDLIAALDGATSWSQVCRRLGIRNGGETIKRLRRRAEALGLDVARLAANGRAQRRWSDDDLVAAVAAASNLRGVFLHLGLAIGGGSWRRMQDHIVRLGLDTSHWSTGAVQPGHGRRRRPRVEIDDAQLRVAVPGARSIAEVARRMSLDPTNGSVHRRLRDRITDLGLPVSGLAGQGWARGRERPDRPRTPLTEILVRDSPYRGGSVRLRERLVAEGLREARCALCGVSRWLGRPAPLQLDHIDGDHRNNELVNLRILCPNCHAQTPTYCGRNIGRG